MTASLIDALKATTAYVELYTGNGVREQPPEWASDFDAEQIAKRGREAIAQAAAEVELVATLKTLRRAFARDGLIDPANAIALIDKALAKVNAS